MMKKIGVIGMFHETNTFAPDMTTMVHFQEGSSEGLDDLLNQYKDTQTSIGGFIDAIYAYGMELAGGIYIKAMPSGMIIAEAGEEILSRVIKSIPLDCDALAISLHGAMVTEEHDDMEGELLERIRILKGKSFPIVATIDLHANVSKRMMEYADMIVGYDTYPHVDMYERAVEAIDLLVRQLRGEIQPTMAQSRPQMLVAPEAMVTSQGMMKELMNRAFEMEQMSEVLNVTICGGFPYSDVKDAGVSFLVTTDRNEQLAHRLADELRLFAWENKQRFDVHGITIEEALQESQGCGKKPIVLIEGADNVGGGSPGDATHILCHLLKSPLSSFVMIWDVKAARKASSLSVGEHFAGYIGGKTSGFSGEPVYIEGIIRSVSDGQFRFIGPYKTGEWGNMGQTAVLEVGSTTIMITEERTMPVDINQVRSVGLDPTQFDVIVVKSAVAWRTAFGDVAKKEILVDTPGCCSYNLSRFIYERITRPIYPFDV